MYVPSLDYEGFPRRDIEMSGYHTESSMKNYVAKRVEMSHVISQNIAPSIFRANFLSIYEAVHTGRDSALSLRCGRYVVSVAQQRATGAPLGGGPRDIARSSALDRAISAGVNPSYDSTSEVIVLHAGNFILILFWCDLNLNRYNSTLRVRNSA